MIRNSNSPPTLPSQEIPALFTGHFNVLLRCEVVLILGDCFHREQNRFKDIKRGFKNKRQKLLKI